MSFDVVCVVGPTASGKTSLSVKLAKSFDGEVISADSMQIYRGMDIGTAKPTAKEMQGVPHRMMGIADPDQPRSAGQYALEAKAVIRELLGRGKLPVLAGGTGLYFDAVLSSNSYGGTSSSPEIRTELEAFLEENGAEALHRLLEGCDPESAGRLHVNDTKRVIRAIEVCRVTGRPLSEHSLDDREKTGEFRPLFIGLLPAPREFLYSRINDRVDQMISDGLVGEVRALLERYGELPGTAAQAIGYKELLPYLNGECSLEGAVEEIKKRSRNYAKRQLSWFRRNKDINWFEYYSLAEFENIVQASQELVRSKREK